MKVLFLSYNGLLEPILPSQAVPYLKGLAGEGHEFVLLTYEKKKDIKRAGREGVETLKESLKKDGIEWRYLKYHKMPPLLSTLFDLFAGFFYALYIIKYRRIKLVHVRGITPGIIMIWLARLVRVKMLFDMRGLLAEEYVGGGMWREGSITYRLVKHAEKRMLMIADAVTVLTKKHHDFNISLGYIADRRIPMEVVPCCVDMAKFNYEKPGSADLRRRLGLEGRLVLMYPGKLGTFYLIDEMLRFFKYMSQRIPEAGFFVVTNDDPGIFTAKAARLGADMGRIVIQEKVLYDRMPDYVSIADAGIFFINPYKKIGSSPIKMGEFLASGIPVVINPGIGDTEELVRENRVGVIVEKFELSCYEKAVQELLDLMKEGRALSRRCRETADKYLSLSGGIEKYDKIYKALE